jgi:hypothetical protein
MPHHTTKQDASLCCGGLLVTPTATVAVNARAATKVTMAMMRAFTRFSFRVDGRSVHDQGVGPPPGWGRALRGQQALGLLKLASTIDSRLPQALLPTPSEAPVGTSRSAPWKSLPVTVSWLVLATLAAVV